MTYIIAEIGQNHNGSFEEAKFLIDAAIEAKASAVKFTLRDLENEMTEEMASQSYESKNSYGKTYMEHRRNLEIPVIDIIKLIDYAKTSGLDCIATFCSGTLLDSELVKEHIIGRLRYIKVASRDITNSFLIDKLAKIDKEIILSSGLSPYSELSLAAQKFNISKINIMHCVSKYPTQPKDLNLLRIKTLSQMFKGINIGYSDHSIGYKAPMLAVAMGANIIEKHITRDTSQKGSDHICSLSPSGFKSMVSEINDVNISLGSKDFLYDESEIDDEIMNNRRKLMRSVCTKNEFKSGHSITEPDLCLLSPGDGISPNNIQSLIGRSLSCDYKAKVKIKESDLK